MKSLIRRWLLALGLIIFGIAQAHSSQTLSAADQHLVNRVDAAADGSLPVLIRLKQADNVLVDYAQSRLARKLNEIAAESSQRFSAKKEIERHFKQSAMVAKRVTRAELRSLLTDPELEVFEDTLKRPSLAQSVARVYPTQNTSAFHGNNQWAVAVLDTGVEKSHPFLANKVVSEACYSGGSGDVNASSFCPNGASASTANNSALPCAIAGCGHGTQVAGIAVGNGNAFDGVARDGRLISVQVYSQINDESFCFPAASCIGAFTSDIIAGLERVYELRNAFSIASVNLSLGSDELFSGSCDDQPERPIIDILTSAGIAVIAATGNSANTSQMRSPACITNSIAVAATADDSDIPWASNNISNQLDLFAPGVSITTSAVGGGFATSSGTSLAAPHVAGAWAVIKHASPNISVASGANLFMTSGPLITQNTVARRRFNLSSVLLRIRPVTPITPVTPRPPNENATIVPVLQLLLDE